MKKQFDFSFIIPNYNSQDYLNDCLQSILKACKEIPQLKVEIILVDNYSTDKSVDIFSKNVPKEISQVILNNKNFGFAKAVNQGIKISRSNWVIITNNDITIASDWLKLISKYIENNQDKKVSTFFGTVLNRDGQKIESQGFKFYKSGKIENINNQKNYNEKPDTNNIIWGAPAAIIVYNKEIINKVGLFDEDFFAYLEDVDLALRLNLLSYKTLYVAQATSFHIGGATSNKMSNFRSKMSLRNWIYIIIKNYSILDFIKNFFSIFEERFRNYSYFIKQTFSCFRLQSIIVIPIQTISIIFEIIFKIPRMLQKRRQFNYLRHNQ